MKKTSTDKTPKQDTSQTPMESKDLKQPVFIRRAKGMPFEEFKKVCIEKFRATGLLAAPPSPPQAKDNTPSPDDYPNEQDLALSNKFEESFQKYLVEHEREIFRDKLQ